MNQSYLDRSSSSGVDNPRSTGVASVRHAALSMTPAERRARAAVTSFVFQRVSDKALFCIPCTSDELMDQHSLSTLMSLNVSAEIKFSYEGCQSSFTVMFVGSPEEARDTYLRLSSAFDQPVVSVDISELMAEISSLREEVNKGKTEIKLLRQDVEKLKKRRAAEPMKNATKPKRQTVCTFQISVGSIRGQLKEFARNPEPLFAQMDIADPPISSLVEKYKEPVGPQLCELRLLVRSNLHDPSVCAQIAITLMVPFSECVTYFFAGPDHSKKRLRKGHLFTKKLFNLTLQNFVNDALICAGAYIFSPDNQQRFLQIAADGFNTRVNNFNSKKQLPIDKRITKDSYFKSMKEVENWHHRLTGLGETSSAKPNYEHDHEDWMGYEKNSWSGQRWPNKNAIEQGTGEEEETPEIDPRGNNP